MKQSNAQRGLVDLFTSDSYRLLRLLVSLQADTVEGRRVRESQEEIAALFGISKGKLNPLMQALVASGCIEKYRSRSGYIVTGLGLQVVGLMGRLERLQSQ